MTNGERKRKLDAALTLLNEISTSLGGDEEKSVCSHCGLQKMRNYYKWQFRTQVNGAIAKVAKAAEYLGENWNRIIQEEMNKQGTPK